MIRAARLCAVAFLGGGLMTGLGGWTVVPATAAQQQMAAHYTNNDPIWTTLRDAKVGEDKAKGQLTAAFSPAVQALAGKPVRISGFMTPLENRTSLHHFILTRRSTTCPFCPPNEPTEAVEVTLDAPIGVTQEEVSVTGALTLVSASDEGLFYQLKTAALAKRPG